MAEPVVDLDATEHALSDEDAAPVELPHGRDFVIVCEGACSPDLVHWDALAWYDTVTPPRIATLRVTHTRHTYVPYPPVVRLLNQHAYQDIYQCAVCGQMRVW